VVAARHEHDVAVGDRDRLVERAVRGVDPLEGEAARVAQAVVVGLLEQRLVGRRVAVVLVRRIARPVTGGGDHLGDEQRLGLLGLHQDVRDPPLLAAGAAGEQLRGVEQARLERAGRRRRADRHLALALDPPGRPGRHVQRGRRTLEDARARRLAEPEQRAAPREEHDARLAVVLAALEPPVEAVDLEADVAPAGALRRDAEYAAVAVRLPAANPQRAHRWNAPITAPTLPAQARPVKRLAVWTTCRRRVPEV
jgi:hypothetical protein